MMKLTFYPVLFNTVSVQNDDQEKLLCDPQSHTNISETLSLWLTNVLSLHLK